MVGWKNTKINQISFWMVFELRWPGISIAQLEVEGDTKILLDAINETISHPWHLDTGVQYLKNSLQISAGYLYIFTYFRHFYRETHFVAKALASVGQSSLFLVTKFSREARST